MVAAVPACRDIAVQLAASKVARSTQHDRYLQRHTANPQRVAGPQCVTLKKGQTTAGDTYRFPNTCWVLQIDGKAGRLGQGPQALFLDQRGLSGCES